MELKLIPGSNFINTLYDRTSDHIVSGMIYSSPLLISQTELSFEVLTSPLCYPLYFVFILSAFFTVSWFNRNGNTFVTLGKTSEDLCKHLAVKMIVPVMFYCSPIILFHEPIPSVIY